VLSIKEAVIITREVWEKKTTMVSDVSIQIRSRCLYIQWGTYPYIVNLLFNDIQYKQCLFYSRLTPHNNQRNPWFEEYWEQTFNCSLNTRTVSGKKPATAKICSNESRFSLHEGKSTLTSCA